MQYIYNKTIPGSDTLNGGACVQPYKYGCRMQNNLLYKETEYLR